jgi:hypothetical protein
MAPFRGAFASDGFFADPLRYPKSKKRGIIAVSWSEAHERVAHGRI